MRLNPDQLRQGDVLLVRAQDQDATEPESIASDGSTVLAHGEVTGHRHRLERASEAQALTGSRIRQLLVGLDAPLIHEEHKTVVIPAGRYDLPRQVEWTDALEPRQVAD